MRLYGVWRPRIRVLVVDDQPLFRTAIASILSSEQGMSVVGTARDGREAVEKVRKLLPDVVLMDLRMPNMDGVTATAQITSHHRSVHVVMLASLRTDFESIVEAMRAGAVGYVHKDAGREDLIGAVRTAAQPASRLDVEEPSAFAAHVSARAEPLPPDGLTARQFQVLKLMTMGLALKQIARELGLAEKTVRNQASLMYAKLRVKDRAHAVLYALHRGIA